MAWFRLTDVAPERRSRLVARRRVRRLPVQLDKAQTEAAVRLGRRARWSLAAWRAWTSPRVEAWARRARRAWPIVLFAWFAWQTEERISLLVTRQFPLGIDARIYYRGVVAWLHGGNPWDALVAVGANTYHYAGSPVTTVLLAPAGLLSEEAFTALWLVLTWVAAGCPLWGKADMSHGVAT